MKYHIGIVIKENIFSGYFLKNKHLENICYKGESKYNLSKDKNVLNEIIEWLKESYEIDEEDMIDLIIISDSISSVENIKSFFNENKHQNSNFTKELFFKLLWKEIPEEIFQLEFFNRDESINIKKSNSIYKEYKKNLENIKKYYLYSKDKEIYEMIKKIIEKEIEIIEEKKIPKGSLTEYCILQTNKYNSR